MKNNKCIEFKKKRELGDILTDVFAFLRANYKPLFSVLLKTSGTILVLLLVSIGYYTHVSSSILSPFSMTTGIELFNYGNVVIAGLVMLTLMLLFYGFVFGTVLHYIKGYTHTHGEIDEQAIINGVKKDVKDIIGLAILSSFILMLGILFCFIPGIYLYVPMSLVFPILVFRNTGVFNAISESFELIKNEWWITFATLLVITILTYIISMIFSIPTMMYAFFKAFTMATESTESDPSTMFDWFFTILNTLASTIQYIIIYILTAISSAFIYFNLHERKYHTGTLEQIDTLGKSL